MNKSLVRLAVVVAVVIVVGGGLLLLSRSSSDSVENASQPNTTQDAASKTPESTEQVEAAAGTSEQAQSGVVTQADLAAADGKNGNKCYVAVDGTVYEIKGIEEWQNGEHTTSNGKASCGGDMSAVINQSPHGKRVLDKLTKVGPLAS